MTEEIKNTYLSLRWSQSRGRDTYGYRICKITDESTGVTHKCSGGGYDMQGTSFAGWLEGTYPERLAAISDKASELYGMRVRDDGTVSLDGACGIESMRNIAKAIGLKLERTYVHHGRQRGDTTGYIVSAA